MRFDNLSILSIYSEVLGLGATLTPEQGCAVTLKCLFEPVISGYYYGPDGLRSPLTVTRETGTPEYQGEENPDPSKYNKLGTYM